MLLTEKTDGLKEELKSPSVSTLRSPSLNRDGGQRHHLAATYNAVLGALPSSLTFIHTWGHVSPRCHMKPELRGEHSRVIHTWAHVTLKTHMMPSQMIAPPRLGSLSRVLIFSDHLHQLWVKYEIELLPTNQS